MTVTDVSTTCGVVIVTVTLFSAFFFFQAMGRIFVGLCQVGAWGCFDEFNRLEERMLSAVSQQVQTIQQSLKEGSSDPCKPTTYIAFFLCGHQLFSTVCTINPLLSPPFFRGRKLIPPPPAHFSPPYYSSLMNEGLYNSITTVKLRED